MENVLELLESNYRNSPSKKAVFSRSFSYTFGELANTAKTIGTHLTKHNLVNSPIAIVASQTPQTIAMMFGVLYSGNYYVLIDPTSPLNRLQLMLNNISVVLCSHNDEISNLLNSISHIAVEVMENINCEIDEQKLLSIRKNVHAVASPPLYMVYTSGSTGTPKGVIKSHEAMLSYVNAFSEELALLNNELIIGNQTPFYFDASAKDVYLMLKLCATLIIIPKELFSFPVKLIEFLNECNINYISWVPSALSIVAQLKTFKCVLPTTLKTVAFVGEVMPVKHLNYWIQHVPQVKFINLYGSSETAGISLYYEVTQQMDESKNLPLGKPLPNCKVMLINENNQLCATGEVGEICISSKILASGYFNDEEKTKQVFVQNPTTSKPELIYRTGDIATYDEHGNLIFVCRKDSQIKHMGHRIELGEIETASLLMPEIDKCCCLYDENKKRINFFYSLIGEISPQQITDVLKTKLPAYMIPNRFVLLNDFPLNKNGKVDRQALKQQYFN